MPPKHTASFILELPLSTDGADERACAIVQDAGRNIGNAVLGEGLRRLDLMRESRADRAARKMLRGEPPRAKPERTNSSGCSRRLDLPGHALQKFARDCRDKCWIRDHLPGHVAQTAATRAFNGILQYAFGKRGRPEFTRMDRYNSFESKDAKSTVIWRDGAVRIAERVMARSEGAMRIAKQLVNLRATGFCIRARRNNA
jgi:putative transposase